MKKEFMINKILPVLLIVAVFFLSTNIILLEGRATKWEEAQETVKEQLRPAELEVIKLTADACDSCASIEEAINQLASLNVDIKKEETVSSTSSKGEELIKTYGIKKIPTFIISGEIEKSEQLTNYFSNNGEIVDEHFIYTAGRAPYYDLPKQEIIGLVSIFTLVDRGCPECTDLSGVWQALKEQGVYVLENNVLEYQNAQGKKLIDDYNIKEIPAVLISKEIAAYPNVLQQLLDAGASEKGEFYALHAIVPPYRNVATDSIVGLVGLVMLSDGSCSECYDVAVNKQILQRFGIALKTENTYDIASEKGKELQEKYAIEKAPIILLSPDASAYQNLVQVWKSIGTIEEDGWFVMRKPEMIGVHKDLKTGKIITLTN